MTYRSVDPITGALTWIEDGANRWTANAVPAYFLEPNDDGQDYCESCAIDSADADQHVVPHFCFDTDQAEPMCSVCWKRLQLDPNSSGGADALALLREYGFDPRDDADCHLAWVALIAAEEADSVSIAAEALAHVFVDWAWLNPLEVPRD